jgi:hypothetical protein
MASVVLARLHAVSSVSVLCCALRPLLGAWCTLPHRHAVLCILPMVGVRAGCCALQPCEGSAHALCLPSQLLADGRDQQRCAVALQIQLRRHVSVGPDRHTAHLQGEDSPPAALPHSTLARRHGCPLGLGLQPRCSAPLARSRLLVGQVGLHCHAPV